jgi:hypothetical protein
MAAKIIAIAPVYVRHCEEVDIDVLRVFGLTQTGEVYFKNMNEHGPDEDWIEVDTSAFDKGP